MYTFKIENHLGEIIDLSHDARYRITSINGLNPVGANINTATNANSDGSVFKSSRLNSRNIVVMLAIVEDVEASRINLYKFIKPKKPCIVYYSNGTRDVKINGYVEKLECNFFQQTEVAQISIICPFPLFGSSIDAEFEFSGSTVEFEFPFSIDSRGIVFSYLTPDGEQIINNPGDVETGIVIEFSATGQVATPRIYNISAGTKMSIGGLPLVSGDLLRIDTRRGQKSIVLIRNGSETNALNYLSSDSEWITLESGDNVLYYSAAQGLSNLSCRVFFDALYEGV